MDGTCAPHLPTLHKLTFVSFPSRIKSQLNDTTTAVSAYTCSCAIVTRARPRDFPNAIGAPARISQPVISGVHGFVLKLTLDALYAVDVRWPGRRRVQHQGGGRRASGGQWIWARRHGSSETRRCCIDLRFQCTRLVPEEVAAFTWSFVARRTWFGGGGLARYC